MESLLTFVCDNAHNAHWILFLLLMLAGLNVPISEDLVLLIAGVISSTCFLEPSGFDTWRLFAWVFVGCWLSAWEAYWIGRLLGPKLYQIKWFSHILTPKRIDNLHYYYEKFGLLTFIVGRFCPGGVRNALFITSGLGKMPFFSNFVARDTVACLISVSTLFYLGRLFGENNEILLKYFHRYEMFAGAVILSVIVGILCFLFWKQSKSKSKT